MLTDTDELFSTRVPTTVTDMLKEPDGCLVHGHNQVVAEQWHLSLVDIYCPTCDTETHVLGNDGTLEVLQRWTVRCVGNHAG